jgi:transcriptional regulator with XRE-family HTH domain
VKTITLTADSPSREVFAANVRRLRTERGLLQEDLAIDLGYRHSRWVCEIEHNRHSPGLDLVDRVAEALGVTAVELLTPPAETAGAA